MMGTMQQDTKIGFIGLGAMGFGMAASLCRAGFAVTGYDLREDAMDRLAERGGARALTPAEAALGARLLFVMVVNDAQVEAVLFGDHGAAAALPAGAPWCSRARCRRASCAISARAWASAAASARCAGERRRGRRRERRAHHHGLGHARSVRGGRSGA